MKRDYIYKSGRSIALELGCRRDPMSSPEQYERSVAREAVSAISEFSRGLVDPLEFGVTRHVADESDWPPLVSGPRPRVWHWYLRATRSPDVRAAYVDPVVFDVETVDESSMLALVDAALGEPCDLSDGEWAGWEEMYLWNTRVRIPESLAPREGDHFVLDDYDNGARDARMPLERRRNGTWVTRSGLGVWSPIGLQVMRLAGSDHPDAVTYDEFVDLTIDVHWSLWWEEGSPGRAMLDQALGRLYERGWRLTFQST